MDRDLQSIQEARDLARRSKEAQRAFEEFSQEAVDRIVEAVAKKALENAEYLAKLAIEETKLGVYEDKITKNRFAAEFTYNYIRDLKTVGFIKEDREKGIYEIAEPAGAIAAIIPTTNPTSTVIHNALIALKARCTIVFSPHPRAQKCSYETAKLLEEAARGAGAPPDTIQCLTIITAEGTDALMRHPDIDLILATGGTALVKKAYSVGKPAIGVGPGNVPAYIERSANVEQAVRNIIASKTFDNGVVCASEQAVIVDRVISDRVRNEFIRQNCYFMTREETKKVESILFSPKGLPSPDIVGQPAPFIARKAGIEVPPDTKILIAELEDVGENYPLSKEKLSPVLAYYEVEDWREGCELCIKMLEFGGLGHTLVIHSENEEIIREFALKKPAFRILVNTGGTHGAIGYSTNLPPSMTLGCGTWGGGITSDNVTPMHLIQIKRLAYPVRDVAPSPRIQDGRSAVEIAHLRHSEPIRTPERTLSEEEIEKIVREFLTERFRK